MCHIQASPSFLIVSYISFRHLCISTPYRFHICHACFRLAKKSQYGKLKCYMGVQIVHSPCMYLQQHYIHAIVINLIWYVKYPKFYLVYCSDIQASIMTSYQAKITSHCQNLPSQIRHFGFQDLLKCQKTSKSEKKIKVAKTTKMLGDEKYQIWVEHLLKYGCHGNVKFYKDKFEVNAGTFMLTKYVFKQIFKNCVHVFTPTRYLFFAFLLTRELNNYIYNFCSCLCTLESYLNNHNFAMKKKADKQ